MTSKNLKMDIARRKYWWLGPFSPIEWVELTDEEIQRLHIKAREIADDSSDN